MSAPRGESAGPWWGPSACVVGAVVVCRALERCVAARPEGLSERVAKLEGENRVLARRVHDLEVERDALARMPGEAEPSTRRKGPRRKRLSVNAGDETASSEDDGRAPRAPLSPGSAVLVYGLPSAPGHTGVRGDVVSHNAVLGQVEVRTAAAGKVVVPAESVAPLHRRHRAAEPPRYALPQRAPLSSTLTVNEGVTLSSELPCSVPSTASEAAAHGEVYHRPHTMDRGTEAAVCYDGGAHAGSAYSSSGIAEIVKEMLQGGQPGLPAEHVDIIRTTSVQSLSSPASKSGTSSPLPLARTHAVPRCVSASILPPAAGLDTIHVSSPAASEVTGASDNPIRAALLPSDSEASPCLGAALAQTSSCLSLQPTFIPVARIPVVRIPVHTTVTPTLSGEFDPIPVTTPAGSPAVLPQPVPSTELTHSRPLASSAEGAQSAALQPVQCSTPTLESPVLQPQDAPPSAAHAAELTHSQRVGAVTPTMPPLHMTAEATHQQPLQSVKCETPRMESPMLAPQGGPASAVATELTHSRRVGAITPTLRVLQPVACTTPAFAPESPAVLPAAVAAVLTHSRRVGAVTPTMQPISQVLQPVSCTTPAFAPESPAVLPAAAATELTHSLRVGAVTPTLDVLPGPPALSPEDSPVLSAQSSTFVAVVNSTEDPEELSHSARLGDPLVATQVTQPQPLRPVPCTTPALSPESPGVPDVSSVDLIRSQRVGAVTPTMPRHMSAELVHQQPLQPVTCETPTMESPILTPQGNAPNEGGSAATTEELTHSQRVGAVTPMMQPICQALQPVACTTPAFAPESPAVPIAAATELTHSRRVGAVTPTVQPLFVSGEVAYQQPLQPVTCETPTMQSPVLAPQVSSFPIGSGRQDRAGEASVPVRKGNKRVSIGLPGLSLSRPHLGQFWVDDTRGSMSDAIRRASMASCTSIMARKCSNFSLGSPAPSPDRKARCRSRTDDSQRVGFGCLQGFTFGDRGSDVAPSEAESCGMLSPSSAARASRRSYDDLDVPALAHLRAMQDAIVQVSSEYTSTHASPMSAYPTPPATPMTAQGSNAASHSSGKMSQMSPDHSMRPLRPLRRRSLRNSMVASPRKAADDAVRKVSAASCATEPMRRMTEPVGGARGGKHGGEAAAHP